MEYDQNARHLIGQEHVEHLVRDYGSVSVDGADGWICGSCWASTPTVARGALSRLGADDENGAPEPHRHELPEGLRRAA